MGLLRWQGRDKIMRTDQTKDGAPSEGTLGSQGQQNQGSRRKLGDCLLYTSDAADDC